MDFDMMKATMIRDCLLQYPNHNQPFVIYTYAIDYQLGAVLVDGPSINKHLGN
jgi:hypothetical protein